MEPHMYEQIAFGLNIRYDYHYISFTQQTLLLNMEYFCHHSVSAMASLYRSDTPHAIRTPDSNLTGVFLLESKVQKWKNECEKMKKRQIWTPVNFFSTPVIYSNYSKNYF